MSKPDWSKLSLNYMETPYRFISYYKNGVWDDGVLSTGNSVVLSEAACVLQYAQTCFEGLKAFTSSKGNIVVFRPDMNAKRFKDTLKRLVMPEYPENKFIEAVLKTVKATSDYVPPYGINAALYIRPFMIGTSPVINVIPSNEYEFRVFTTPLGSYFKNDSSMKLLVGDYDRAAPHGTGNVKAGLNYAMSFYASHTAKEKGYNECMYLDASSRKYVEETGTANIIFVDKEGTLVVPFSKSILPSITRKSLIYIAKEYLNIKVEERPVEVNELQNFSECGLCGTAAVISPVGSVDIPGSHVEFKDSLCGRGPVLEKLYKTYTAIQKEEIPAPEGWLYKV